jgi:membrane fusion protein, type I secretion system
VVGLDVFTEGGVIQPAAKLMDIVPSDNPLIVDARLKLSDINEVTVGRQADVRLTGVNYIWSGRTCPAPCARFPPTA